MPRWFFEMGRQVGSFGLLGLAAAFVGLAAVPPVFGLLELYATFGLVAAIVAAPFAYIAWGLLFCTLIVVFKRATFLKVGAGRYPILSFTTGMWATTGYLSCVAETLFVQFLKGTPFMVLWYRALGAKIGKRVSINSSSLGDWDLLEIGDDTIIGAGAVVIGHVVEMGELVMKPIKIGKGCTIGLNTMVMPGAQMKDGSVVGAMSLVTKGKVLEENKLYGGAPAVFLRDRGPRTLDAPAKDANDEPQSEAGPRGLAA